MVKCTWISEEEEQMCICVTWCLEGADPRDVRGIVGLNPAEVHDHTQVLNSLYNMLCEWCIVVFRSIKKKIMIHKQITSFFPNLKLDKA